MNQLGRPKMRDIDTEMVLRLVAENAKQRFELAWGYDPSPAKVKPKKGQRKGKGKGKSKPKPPQAVQAEGGGTDFSAPAKDTTHQELVEEAQGDAAKVDDLAADLEKTNIQTELPLVILPRPDTDGNADGNEDDSAIASTSAATGTNRGEWFIRATQGHSIKLDSVSHLALVTDDEEGRAKAGVCVHGTKWELWDTLSGYSFPSHLRETLELSLKSCI